MMVIANSIDGKLSILDNLFIPSYRARFLNVLGSRFSSSGIGILRDFQYVPQEDGEDAIREILNNVAETINVSLGADETVVAFFRESEGGSCLAGSSRRSSGEDRASLLADISRLMQEGLFPAVSTCSRVDRATGVYGSEALDVAGAALVTPIFVDNKISGIVAAAEAEGKPFSPGDEAKLRLASVLLASVAQETISERQNEERLRSLAHGLSAAVDARDPRTKGHSHRVAMYAMAIVNEMDCDERDPSHRGLRDRIRIAALLHDIGKVGVPDSILLKEGKLTDEEYESVQQHSVMGAEIVTACYGLKDLVPGILYHHEHFDGSGYPFGLTGDSIPLMAKVIALADAFDGMTSEQPLRKALSHEEAVELLKGEISKNFDPLVLSALFRAHQKGALKYVRIPPRSERFDKLSGSAVENVYCRELKSIPALPRVLATMKTLLDDPRASLKEIAKVLSTDEGLASRVLTLVNSAYYGLPRMVSTIPLATTILGANAIKNHVVDIAFADLMRVIGGAREEYESLWRHTLKTACWAKAISSKLGDVDPEEAFTAGLVHDIGKALSLRFKPTDYGKLILEVEKSGRPLMGVEEQVVGFDHTHMGAWAATRWMLPQSLVNSIRWHHDPEGLGDECKEIYNLVRVIHIADIGARASQIRMPSFTTFVLEELSPRVLRELGSEYFAGIEEMKGTIEEAVKKLEDTFAQAGVAVS